MLEFALVFPILLILILGIIQLALAYNAKAIVGYAAFSAARSYIVYQDRARAESAARIVCLSISARPSRMAATALSSLGIDVPDPESLGPLDAFAGVAERIVYSSYATQVRIYDSDGSPVDEGRVLEPGKEDVTVEVTHKFRLAIPIVNKLAGRSMLGEEIGSFFDAGLYYLPLTERAILTVEDAPASPDKGPCFGNVSLGCCFSRDEVQFIQCRGDPACASPECCPERSRRAWRVTEEAAKRGGSAAGGRS